MAAGTRRRQMDPEKDTMFRVIVVVMLAVVAVALVFDGATRRVTNAFAAERTTQAASVSTATATSSTYKPVTRTFIVTTVPLLVHEQTGQFDYLGQDFAKGGLLDGKEVWGFSPSTL